MSRVRMRRAVADGGGNAWQRDREYDVDEHLADAWTSAGIAERVDDVDEVAQLVQALRTLDVDELTDEQRDALEAALRDCLEQMAGPLGDGETEQPEEPAEPQGGGDGEVSDQQQPEQRDRPRPVKATRTPARKAVKPAPAEPAKPADE